MIKVLEGKESALKGPEARALARFERSENDVTESDGDQVLSFADQFLRESESNTSSRYIDLRWIPATSNEVERLFSRAGLVLTSRRRAMHPTTLESLLF